MNEEIANYIYKHTFLITLVIIAAFAALAAGEYVLYKNQIKLSEMTAEGLMQIKEEIKNQGINRPIIMPLPQPEAVPGATGTMMAPQESPMMRK